MSPKCALKVILEPPSAIQPGKVLFPPLILSIQLEEGVREKTQPASDRLPDVGQLWRAEPGHVALDQAFEGLWAIIHLVPQGTNGTLGKASMATHPMALSGKLADTPHRAVSQPLEAGLRYLKFEDLAIHEIGTFSLRISLCRMSYVQGGAGAGPEAATIGCVSTRSILVHPCAACEPIGVCGRWESLMAYYLMLPTKTDFP